MENQGVQSPQIFLVKTFFFLQLLRKHEDIGALSSKFWGQMTYLKQFFGYEKQKWLCAFIYYFEVEFNFQKDW